MIYLVMMMWKNGKKEKTIMNEVKTFTDQPAPPGSTATLKRDVLEKMLGDVEVLLDFRVVRRCVIRRQG
ncbi:hypothetical protein T03_16893 [Trichinella britovi]|uniref:Uncharacterized protein n=1 Tax=Trichinella britovi TaxID=45882 RepID=A0A0V1BD99_TRIBR|nr:hypothetical protein T03_16893 [Trichinella britovi]